MDGDGRTPVSSVVPHCLFIYFLAYPIRSTTMPRPHSECLYAWSTKAAWGEKTSIVTAHNQHESERSYKDFRFLKSHAITEGKAYSNVVLKSFLVLTSRVYSTSAHLKRPHVYILAYYILAHYVPTHYVPTHYIPAHYIPAQSISTRTSAS
ncbi:hypothetical protein BDW02DRAFT_27253 [Decorospora gaudefroyi]|uniref:Uncharacterized protein n=1 Tax=Decorospora gaudefroyi TaxID=184978 RepID=A0A6A5KA15_9PLEO|nr:hypothetical protein BDW02DRAFT_27253 [Decorospora gaudefroyi]